MRSSSRFAVIALTGLFMLFGGTAPAAAADVPGPEGELKEFKMITLDGEEHASEIFEDTDVTIINIWGTYCGPCIQEMPLLAGFAKTLPERVRFMTLCIDALGQEEDVNTFLTKVGFEDPSTAIIQFEGDVLDMLGQVMYIPTTITIDKDGNILDPYIIGSPASVSDAYTELTNKALEQLELPLLGEEEEAVTESITEGLTE